MLLLVLAGCSSTARLASNQAAAQNWLDSQQGAAGINISGKWTAKNWGDGQLTQSGRQVAGNIDTYAVKGVVSGREVFLTFWHEEWCHYTMIGSPAGKGIIRGYYADVVPYEDNYKRFIELRRIR